MKQTLLGAMLLGITASTAWAAPDQLIVDVYKSPTCGCCSKWVDHLKANGFQVRAHNTPDVAAHKVRLGVPAGYGSCHTAQVGGYLVEGHVPAKEIKRLLKENPSARGLVVPAMPMGSPGMEAGGRKDAYDVFLVNRDGSTKTYAHYMKGMNMKPMLTTLVLGMSLGFGMPVLASGDHGHSHDGAANTSTMPAMNAAMSDGQVKKVDKSQGKITLKHGPIENMGMPGMTMVFRVQDASMLDQVKPGDNIRFHAAKMDGAMMVTKLEMAK